MFNQCVNRWAVLNGGPGSGVRGHTSFPRATARGLVHRANRLSQVAYAHEASNLDDVEGGHERSIKEHMKACEAHHNAAKHFALTGNDDRFDAHVAKADAHSNRADEIRSKIPYGMRNAAILNGGPGSGIKGHQTAPKTGGKAVPGINDWNQFAGGTSAAEGKHSYQFNHPTGQTYSIDPISNQYGRHRGYRLGVYPAQAGLHGTIDQSGNEQSMFAPLHRTPAQAVTAAKLHAANVEADPARKQAVEEYRDKSKAYRLSQSNPANPSVQNTKAGRITYDGQGRIVNFVPAHALQNSAPSLREKFSAHIERFSKNLVICNTSEMPNPEPSQSTASQDPIFNDEDGTPPETGEQLVNKEVPLAAPVTDPKQATEAEQAAAIKKADEQPGVIVNSGTPEGVKKAWETRHGAAQKSSKTAFNVNTEHAHRLAQEANYHAAAAGSKAFGWKSDKYNEHTKAFNLHGEIADHLAGDRQKTNHTDEFNEWKAKHESLANSKVVGQPVAVSPEKIANSAFVVSDMIHLAPIGEYSHPSGLMQVITPEAVQAMANNFAAKKASDPSWGGALIDYDHKSATGKGSEAAGWLTNVEARPDGLWGKVAWTPSGKEAVQNGVFRYVSPVWNRSDCTDLGNDRVTPTVLDSLAICNNPNMEMTPISKILE